MKRKTVILLTLLSLAAAIFSGCSKEERTYIGFATGGSSGAYYQYGSAIADAGHLDIEVLISGGAVQNAQALLDGDADLAIMPGDVADYSAHGTDLCSEQKANKELKTVISLYGETVQIVAASGIKSVSDLKGRTVAVGTEDSRIRYIAEQIMAAYGLSFEDADIVYRDMAEASADMQRGKIDAAFIISVLPSDTVDSLISGGKFRLLGIEEKYAEILKSNYGYYVDSSIPGGTYEGAEDDISSVGILTAITANGNADEELVYSVAKTVVEKQKKIEKSCDRAALLDTGAVTAGSALEIHPGAERYFTEAGLM